MVEKKAVSKKLNNNGNIQRLSFPNNCFINPGFRSTSQHIEVKAMASIGSVGKLIFRFSLMEVSIENGNTKASNNIK